VPKKVRIPSERATARRADLLKTYHHALRAGAIDTPERDGEFFKERFLKYAGTAVPKDGWPHTSIELRLVELASVWGFDGLGNAQVASICRKHAASLSMLSRELQKLEDVPEFLFARLYLEINHSNWTYMRALASLESQLRQVALHLDKFKQKAKWRSTIARKRRIRLACLLTPLFEEQFGQPAKPCGGSSPVPSEETNDWTRFYQMAVSVFWEENTTPDLQAILWEATLPPAW